MGFLMQFKTNTIDNESIAVICLYGDNRNVDVITWHARVLINHFNLHVNYVKGVFPYQSHGWHMNQLISQTIDQPDAPDYYFWLDNDCVPLRREALGLAYQQVRDKMTIWGHAWQSNHLKGPNGMIPHPYASQACLMFSTELYNRLGRPSMDHTVEHCDTAENLTYAAKKGGFNVSLLYPSHSILADTPLDNGMRYGMGNTYGPQERPLWFHCSSAPHSRHVEAFTETCKMVMCDSFEGLHPASPYV